MEIAILAKMIAAMTGRIYNESRLTFNSAR
jgi:hypothetical protein